MSPQVTPLQVALDPSLGSRIRARRRAQGLSQAKLAGSIGVTQQTIATWEAGGRPEPKYFPAIKDFLAMESEDEVVALLDAHDHHRRARATDVEPVTVPAGLSPRQALDMLTEAFVTRLSAGMISPAQEAIFARLIDFYEEAARSGTTEAAGPPLVSDS